MRCPKCGNELDEDNYCFECMEFFDDTDEDSQDFEEEPDYNSMVNNGDSICLNCTYWSVSPYGSAHGMYCRRGNGQTEPNDTCFDFAEDMTFFYISYELIEFYFEEPTHQIGPITRC